MKVSKVVVSGLILGCTLSFNVRPAQAGFFDILADIAEVISDVPSNCQGKCVEIQRRKEAEAAEETRRAEQRKAQEFVQQQHDNWTQADKEAAQQWAQLEAQREAQREAQQAEIDAQEWAQHEAQVEAEIAAQREADLEEQREMERQVEAIERSEAKAAEQLNKEKLRKSLTPTNIEAEETQGGNILPDAFYQVTDGLADTFSF